MRSASTPRGKPMGWRRSRSSSALIASSTREESKRSSFTIIPAAALASGWRWIGKRRSFRPATFSGNNGAEKAGQLPPLIDWNDFLSNRLAHVFAQRPEEAVVFQLLKNVGTPSRRSRDREDRREQIRWYTE